jgi:hypothetical protein
MFGIIIEKWALYLTFVKEKHCPEIIPFLRAVSRCLIMTIRIGRNLKVFREVVGSQQLPQPSG